MSLKEQLVTDMKAAMRDREAGKARLSAIRMIRSAVRNAEIEKGRELDDEGVIEVVAREAKKKRETIEAFAGAGRHDRVEQLSEELHVLESYLPRQLSEAELRDLASQVIQEVGGRSLADMGKVMGRIMPEVKGRADGATVNRIVRELLAGD